MKELTFPVLDLQEILNCLQELSINIQDSELKKPSTQVILDILCQFLPLFNLEYSIKLSDELLQDSLDFINLYKLLWLMVTKSQITDFSLLDLLFPSPKRFRFVSIHLDISSLV